MKTKEGFFSLNTQTTLVSLGKSHEENSQLLENPSIQAEHQPIQVADSFDAKQFVKSFLEQAKGTALGGAVLVNHVILALSMMGHKFTADDHKRLETLLLSYWGLRGGAAGMMAITGLKNKAPDATAAYILTEKNVIKMLAIASFLRKMPIPNSFSNTLQIACSILVLMDQGLSAKALVEEKADPSNFSYSEIKDQYQGKNALIALMTLKEMLFRTIQMGATTYTAGYALADVFVDAKSPVDPANQKQILMCIVLAFSILQALCVFHPVSSQIANQIRSIEINIGLVFLPLVSLMFDYLPQWFSNNSLETGVIGCILVGLIPAILEATVSFWAHQDKIAAQDEETLRVEDLIEENGSIRCGS
ncbi:MAG: hypothetical protein H0U57_05325 [Tatlockia sp.]|nr:hypothetical protein [Tatlockia sp.]